MITMSATNTKKIIPAVVACYHVPPIWVDAPPSKNDYEQRKIEIVARDVASHEFANGLKVRVRRDGLFVYDFTNCHNIGETEMPHSEISKDNKLSDEYLAADRAADERLLQRTIIINSHQACLHTSVNKVDNRHMPMLHLLSATNCILLSHISHNSFTYNMHEATELYTKKLVEFNGLSTPLEKYERPQISISAVNGSFALFEDVLDKNFPRHVELIDLLCKACAQYRDSRYSEALVLSWTVIENVLRTLWSRYTKSCNTSDQSGTRINSKRKEILEGAQFTISVITEVLELSGIVPLDLYKSLCSVRKNRNDWLHNQRLASEKDASAAISTARTMLARASGIEVVVNISRSSVRIVSHRVNLGLAKPAG